VVIKLNSGRAQIAFIGFGEAGQAFASGLSSEPDAPDFHAFDIKTDGPSADEKHADYRTHNVTGTATCAEVCGAKDAIFSLVTADQAEAAAKAAAEANLDGAFFFDCNSCSPNAKRRSAARIEAAGGRYVDVAVMTPVHPRQHKSPCLISGPHVRDAAAAMQHLGMSIEVAGDEIGLAATRKMVRSIMIKGLEALTLECFLAARKAGVETETLASLEASFPSFDWQKRAPYMLERAMTHGIRRAEEMEHAVQTLKDLGLAQCMTDGTVKRQREIGNLGLSAEAIGADDLPALCDAILAALDASETG
jgi:3-hydroxyisobutyrate dehydrogenase-like beta-hydroxyacid dehydrogenase